MILQDMQKLGKQQQPAWNYNQVRRYTLAPIKFCILIKLNAFDLSVAARTSSEECGKTYKYVTNYKSELQNYSQDKANTLEPCKALLKNN